MISPKKNLASGVFSILLLSTFLLIWNYRGVAQEKKNVFSEYLERKNVLNEYLVVSSNSNDATYSQSSNEKLHSLYYMNTQTSYENGKLQTNYQNSSQFIDFKFNYRLVNYYPLIDGHAWNNWQKQKETTGSKSMDYNILSDFRKSE